MFVQLTIIDDMAEENDMDNRIWVNVDHIQFFQVAADENGTAVFVSDDIQPVHVKESPEAIVTALKALTQRTINVAELWQQSPHNGERLVS